MFFLNFQGLTKNLNFTIKSSVDHKPQIYAVDSKTIISSDDELSSGNFIQITEFLPVEIFFESTVVDSLNTTGTQEALLEVVKYINGMNVPGLIYPQLPKNLRRMLKRKVVGAKSEQEAVEKFFGAMGSATLSDPVKKKNSVKRIPKEAETDAIVGSFCNTYEQI